jgi:sulfur carrier protein
MIINVNGEEKSLNENSLSVARFLKVMNVENPDMISVQVNGRFVEKGAYETTMIVNKDDVDFLYFLGGGDW